MVARTVAAVLIAVALSGCYWDPPPEPSNSAVILDTCPLQPVPGLECWMEADGTLHLTGRLTGPGGPAMFIQAQRSLVLQDLDVTGFDQGIYIGFTNGCSCTITLRDVHIEGTDADVGTGLALTNYVSSAGELLPVDVVLKNVHVAGFQKSVEMLSPALLTIDGLRMDCREAGIRLNGIARTVARGLDVNACVMAAFHAANFDDLLIMDSVFKENGVGLDLDGNASVTTVLRNVTLAQNGLGASLGGLVQVHDALLVDNGLRDPPEGFQPGGLAFTEGLLFEVAHHISGSHFSGNQPFAVQDALASPIDAVGNWWGSATGPTFGNEDSYLGVPGLGDVVDATVLVTPWLTSPP